MKKVHEFHSFPYFIKYSTVNPTQFYGVFFRGMTIQTRDGIASCSQRLTSSVLNNRIQNMNL